MPRAAVAERVSTDAVAMLQPEAHPGGGSEPNTRVETAQQNATELEEAKQALARLGAERDSLASQLQQARGEVQQAVADRAAAELRAAQLLEAKWCSKQIHTSSKIVRGLRAKIKYIHPTHAVVTRGIWTWCAKCAAATTGLRYKLLAQPCLPPNASRRHLLWRVARGLPPCQQHSRFWGDEEARP